MDWFDLINGGFEIVAGFAQMLHIKSLYQHKLVRGVHWFPIAFFTSWGLWNLVYYPSLGQWISFWGGVLLVSVNAWRLGLMWYYIVKEKRYVF